MNGEKVHQNGRPILPPPFTPHTTSPACRHTQNTQIIHSSCTVWSLLMTADPKTLPGNTQTHTHIKKKKPNSCTVQNLPLSTARWVQRAASIDPKRLDSKENVILFRLILCSDCFLNLHIQVSHPFCFILSFFYTSMFYFILWFAFVLALTLWRLLLFCLRKCCKNEVYHYYIQKNQNNNCQHSRYTVYTYTRVCLSIHLILSFWLFKSGI